MTGAVSVHPSMLAQLKLEAAALAALPAHQQHGYWSINAHAGTVIDLDDHALIAFLHPAVLDPLPGYFFLPHDRGTT